MTRDAKDDCEDYGLQGMTRMTKDDQDHYR